MKSAKKIFSEGEVKDLLRRVREQARRGRFIDKCDHALVTFAWATGFRASEIASVS